MMNKKGITITELIVSTMLIGIVMLGVISFSLAIKRMQDATSKGTILSLRMTTTLRQIKLDAEKAVGDPFNPGIETNISGSNHRLCFRHDTGTLFDSSDDTWVCFSHDSAFHIMRCENPTPQDCVPGDTELLRLSQAGFYTLVNDGDGRLDYIDISLTSRYVRTEPVDPLDNPEISMSTRVSPLGVSR